MLLLIFYLIGMPVGYICFKKSIIEDGSIWTISDRHIGIVLSFLSWLMLIEYFLFMGMSNNEKPAKW